MQDILINKKITSELHEKLCSLSSESDPILFAIVGDLTLESKYGKSILLATRSELLVYDDDSGKVQNRISFGNVESFFTKRMYGNGVLRAREKGDGKPIDILFVCLFIF